MKLLLKAALRSRQHLSLLIITFATLLCLTVASQMEMFALGVLSNNGADFFSLFSLKRVLKVLEIQFLCTPLKRDGLRSIQREQE